MRVPAVWPPAGRCGSGGAAPCARRRDGGSRAAGAAHGAGGGRESAGLRGAMWIFGMETVKRCVLRSCAQRPAGGVWCSCRLARKQLRGTQAGFRLALVQGRAQPDMKALFLLFLTNNYCSLQPLGGCFYRAPCFVLAGCAFNLCLSVLKSAARLHQIAAKGPSHVTKR